MRYPVRHHSQLLFRKSTKPNRVLRFRPAKLRIAFRPAGFGAKPQITAYECETP